MARMGLLNGWGNDFCLAPVSKAYRARQRGRSRTAAALFGGLVDARCPISALGQRFALAVSANDLEEGIAVAIELLVADPRHARERLAGGGTLLEHRL